MINYAESAKMIASIMEPSRGAAWSAPQCIHQLFQLLPILTEPGLEHDSKHNKIKHAAKKGRKYDFG